MQGIWIVNYPLSSLHWREGLAETPASFIGCGIRRLIYANTSEIYVFRLNTRVRRKITGKLDSLRGEWVKGTFFLKKSFSSLPHHFLREKKGWGGDGGWQ